MSDPANHHEFLRQLRALTEQAGFELDWDDLPAVTACEPHLITDWARAAGRHVTLALARHLLTEPIEFLRQETATGPIEHLSVHTGPLAQLVALHDSLSEDLDTALADLRRACQSLAELQFAWPVPSAGPNPATPGAPGDPLSELNAALRALGLVPVPGPGGSVDAERVTYQYAHENGQVIVSVAPGHDPCVEITIIDVHSTSTGWKTFYRPGESTSIILAAVRAALPATPRLEQPDPSRQLKVCWAPGHVQIPGLGGPYPALVTDHLTAEGWALARFSRDTLTRIAADCRALATKVGGHLVTQIQMDDDLVEIITGSGTPNETTQLVAPDREGLYQLDGWAWEPAEPPNPSTRKPSAPDQ